MTIFSFILIGIVIMLFRIYDFKKAYVALFSLMVTCYTFFNSAIFMTFSFKTIMCYEMLEYIVFMFSIFLLWKNGMTKKQVSLIILWYIFILINILFIKIYPSNVPSVTYPNIWSDFLLNGIYYYPSITKQVLQYSIYFAFLPVIIFALKNTFSSEEIFKLGEKIYVLFSAALVFSLIQFIFVLLGKLDLFYVIRDCIFGSYTFSADIIVRNNIFSFYGFCSEPSAMAFSIFCYQLLTITYSKKSLKILLIFLTTILAFFTGSLSYLIYLIAIIVIVCIKFIDKIYNFILMYLKFLPILLLLLAIILFWAYYQGIFSYYISRIFSSINVVLGNNVVYTSEFERLLSIKYTWNAFLSRFLIGTGVGTVYCFSALITLLSEIGIIGLIILFFIISQFFNGFKNRKWLTYYILIFIIYISLGSLSAFIYPEFYLILLIVHNFFIIKAN